MRIHGLREPEFEEKGHFFRVTFYGPGDEILDLVKSRDRVDLRTLGLNDRQIEALRLMTNEGVIFTNREYRKHFRVSNQTCVRDMRYLEKQGLIRVEGKGKAVVYRVK